MTIICSRCLKEIIINQMLVSVSGLRFHLDCFIAHLKEAHEEKK